MTQIVVPDCLDDPVAMDAGPGDVRQVSAKAGFDDRIVEAVRDHDLRHDAFL